MMQKAAVACQDAESQEVFCTFKKINIKFNDRRRASVL